MTRMLWVTPLARAMKSPPLSAQTGSEVVRASDISRNCPGFCLEYPLVELNLTCYYILNIRVVIEMDIMSSLRQCPSNEFGARKGGQPSADSGFSGDGFVWFSGLVDTCVWRELSGSAECQ